MSKFSTLLCFIIALIFCGITYANEKLSLRDYFESRISAQDKALELARQGIDKRLESMNEFRAQLNQQASTFMTREYYDAKHETMQKQVDELMLSRAELQGKASQGSVVFAYGIGIVGVMIGVFGLIKK